MNIFGTLLLILALCLLYPYTVEFREWFRRTADRAKRRRLRKASIATNYRLYDETGNEWYLLHAHELEKEAV